MAWRQCSNSPNFSEAEKSFFKVYHVGTLNFDLRVSEKIHKTRGESDPSRLRKLPKIPQNTQKLNLADFWKFLDIVSVKDDQIDF